MLPAPPETICSAHFVENQLDDPAGGISLHPVPLTQRRRRVPVRYIPPKRAVGRIIKRLQHLSIRRRVGVKGG